jgi:hypothetical protein
MTDLPPDNPNPPIPPTPSDLHDAPTPQSAIPPPPSEPEAPNSPTATAPPKAPRPNQWATRWTAIRSGLSKATGHSPELTTNQQIPRRTFVSFTAFTLLGVAAWKSWFWVKDGVQSDGVQGALRKGLNVDDRIFKHTLSRNHLAKTYPISEAAKNVRYNSGLGLSTNGFDAAAWRLQVTTVDNRSPKPNSPSNSNASKAGARSPGGAAAVSVTSYNSTG